MPNWFHFSCFFKKNKVKAPGEIGGFDAIRWEDQEKVKNKIDGGAGSVRAVTGCSRSDDLLVEYAKSSRSKCKNCKEQIVKV